jgi:hypothetical protein
MDKVILKKDGLWTSEWDGKKKKNIVRKLDTTTHLFLEAWHTRIELKGKVTLRDLAKYLKSMDPLVLDLVAKLCHANLQEYLTDDLLVPKKDPDRQSKLTAIQVYKYYELSNYSDIKKFDMQDHTVSAHGIGEEWPLSPGEKPPKTKEEKAKRAKCNSYAIEFTPWCYMLHLPLTMKETVALCRHRWKKQKPKRMGFKKKGSTEFERGLSWVSDRTTDKYENEDVGATYTLGEFLYGLFNELCFFWSPSRREEQEKVLMDRYEKCKTAKPDDYSELVEE